MTAYAPAGTDVMATRSPHVVGVLGGMGSYVTLHVFERLLDAWDVDKEWERPRIVIDNHCVLPSRTRAILYDERRDELVQGMADAIGGLLRYDPTLILLPCHTAHSFLPEVRARLGGVDDRVLEMPALVAERCAAAGLDQAMLLATEGTVAARTYDGTFEPHGIAVRYPDDAQRRRVTEYIEQVKRRQDLDTAGFVSFAETLGIETVVLGCTELSVLYTAIDPGTLRRARVKLVDPIGLLVERVRERIPPGAG